MHERPMIVEDHHCRGLRRGLPFAVQRAGRGFRPPVGWNERWVCGAGVYRRVVRGYRPPIVSGNKRGNLRGVLGCDAPRMIGEGRGGGLLSPFGSRMEDRSSNWCRAAARSRSG